MAAALRSLRFWTFFLVSLLSLALAQDENQFIYHGFNESKLHLDGLAKIHSNGLLQLTNNSELQTGHASYPFPIKFNTSSSQSLSFSTNFAFAIVPVKDSGGHGFAFVISPYMDFGKPLSTGYLGLLNSTSDNGRSTNHIFAVELDTVQTAELNDIDGNHVGIDVNSLISNTSAPAAYFSDDGKNKSLDLLSGNPIQIWIDHNGEEKLLNVTLAPITIPKPNRPLLIEQAYLLFTGEFAELIGNLRLPPNCNCSPSTASDLHLLFACSNNICMRRLQIQMPPPIQSNHAATDADIEESRN